MEKLKKNIEKSGLNIKEEAERYGGMPELFVRYNIYFQNFKHILPN